MDENIKEHLKEEREKQRLAVAFIPVKAKVIDVYDEETSDCEPFSYKYEYTNPTTGLLEQDYDDNDIIESGELMYSIGDEVEVMYQERKPRPGDHRTSIIRRTPIFPLEVKSRRRKSSIIKFIVFFVIFFFSILLCALSEKNRGSSLKPAEDSSIEQTIEDTETTENSTEEK
jgi:hypothetical protein